MILMNDFKAEPRRTARGDGRGRCARVRVRLVRARHRKCRHSSSAWAAACGIAHCARRGQRHGRDRARAARARHRPGRRGDHHADDGLRDRARDPARRRDAGASPTSTPTPRCSSPTSVRRCLSPRTRAVRARAPVRPDARHGRPGCALCREAGIDLIEDCAQSHLARWNGQVAGSFGRGRRLQLLPDQEPRRDRRRRRARHAIDDTRAHASAGCATTARASATSIR